MLFAICATLSEMTAEWAVYERWIRRLVARPVWAWVSADAVVATCWYEIWPRCHARIDPADRRGR